MPEVCNDGEVGGTPVPGIPPEPPPAELPEIVAWVRVTVPPLAYNPPPGREPPGPAGPPAPVAVEPLRPVTLIPFPPKPPSPPWAEFFDTVVLLKETEPPLEKSPPPWAL